MSASVDLLLPAGSAVAGAALGWSTARLTGPYCGRPGSRRKAAIALVSGAVFASFTWRFGPSAPLPAFLCLGLAGTLLLFIDLAVHRLPDLFTLPAYPVGAALLAAAAPFTAHGWSRFGHALIGMVALFLLYAVQHLIRPAAMGFGDVKLAGVLGLYLGWFGWSTWFTGTLLGFILGGVASVGLLAARRVTLKANIPFGPFMLAGAFVAILIAP